MYMTMHVGCTYVNIGEQGLFMSPCFAIYYAGHFAERLVAL